MKKTKSLDRLIDTIVQDCSPEKIFLISHFEREDNYSHPQLDVPAGSKKVATYDLLVLIDQDRDFEEVSEFLESRTAIIANTTVLVYPIESVNKVIDYGHSFPLGLLKHECLIYDADNVELERYATIDTICNPYPGPLKYSRAFAIAEEFFASANLHILRQDREIAAYCLYQCVIQLYAAALLKGTGIWFVTDDITRLQRYNYWHSSEMRELLQIDKETGLNICKSLQKANYNSRFNYSYQVSDRDIHLYQTEIKKLFDLTLKILKDPSTI